VWSSDETGATARAVSSASKRLTKPLQPREGSEASLMASSRSTLVPSSTSGAPGRSAPSAPKPPIASKSAHVNSTHAVQAKLAFLLNLYCTYRSPFVQMVRSWRSQLSARNGLVHVPQYARARVSFGRFVLDLILCKAHFSAFKGLLLGLSISLCCWAEPTTFSGFSLLPFLFFFYHDVRFFLSQLGQQPTTKLS
jgi:hypothetical protein